MKRKKVFNGYLPRIEVKGTFDNPNYSVSLYVPVAMERGYDKRENYDCMVDPMEELFTVIEIVNKLFNNAEIAC